MTRSLDAAAVGAVTAGHAPYLFFIQLDFSQPLRVCSAGYDVDWNGATWMGIGALGSIEPIQEQASLEAIGVQLTLSGVPSEVIAITLAEQYQGKPCQIWFAPLRGDLQLATQPIRLFAGRMDTMNTEVGDTATITLSAESRMVTWDRPRTRRYNNEDQQSRYPGDRGFEYVAQMVEKSLIWGALMERLQDWPSRLAEFVESRRDVGFARGKADCCMLVADAVQAMTGVDYAARWRGTYSTDKAAFRLLRDYGGVAGVATLLLGPAVSPALAGRGDVVLIEAPEGEALALCLGDKIAVQDRNGLTFAPTSAAKAAWKV